MIEFSTILTVAIASFFLTIVPGPSVTLIVANSIRTGVRAGLMTVAGTQLGVFTMVLIVAAGLETIVSIMGEAFFWIKIIGAAYLIWLGYKLLRSDGSLGEVEGVTKSHSGYFWQGFLVLWANPKALLFIGAFIPQFVDPTQNAFIQTLLCGMIFMTTTTIFDSLYAILSGKAGEMLTKSRVRLVERISGSMLIGGGIWIALMRKA